VKNASGRAIRGAPDSERHAAARRGAVEPPAGAKRPEPHRRNQAARLASETRRGYNGQHCRHVGVVPREDCGAGGTDETTEGGGPAATGCRSGR